MPLTPTWVRTRLLGATLALALLAAACGSEASDDAGAASPASEDQTSEDQTSEDQTSGDESAADQPAADQPTVTDFEALREQAQGQTVRWWLFGGDDRINAYIDDHVVPAAEALGISVERVPISDTADAVQRVLAENRAGEEEGSVDLIWINGENFAAGKNAGLWLEDWARELPNADLVDPETVDTDFGVAVDGQESPWSRGLFVYAHDTDRLPQPPRSLDDLMSLARAEPGRFTYPAPPDFTGSAFVRQVVTAMGEDEAMEWLAELAPLLWQEGRNHPGSEAELNQLFANGEVDLAMSYDPGFVQTGVAQGTFPESTRPFMLEQGTLHNVSYVTIPANAANREGGLVLANLLLEPALQARKADPDILGVPTVLDLARLTEDQRAAFDAARQGPYLLDDHGPLVDELPVERVEAIEERWRDEVLR
ncbi:MAG: ABC transporter substrate-binding protein [Nitriliruptoraceae bacterium]